MKAMYRRIVGLKIQYDVKKRLFQCDKTSWCNHRFEDTESSFLHGFWPFTPSWATNYLCVVLIVQWWFKVFVKPSTPRTSFIELLFWIFLLLSHHCQKIKFQFEYFQSLLSTYSWTSPMACNPVHHIKNFFGFLSRFCEKIPRLVDFFAVIWFLDCGGDIASDPILFQL